MSLWTVWTDGSGTTGGPAGIGYYAICAEENEVKEGSLPLANATNQQAEILAVGLAFHELREGSDVIVVTDSEYVHLGVTEPNRLPLWRTNGWRKRTGGAVANQRHWQRLIAAVDRHASVTVEWTRGHAGTVGNERADALAVAAREQAKRDLATVTS